MSGAGSFLNNAQYLGVSVLDWMIIICIAVVLWMSLSYVKRRCSKRLAVVARRTETHWDDIAVRMINRTHGVFLFVVSFYVASRIMGADDKAIALLYKLTVVATFFQAALWGNELVGYGLSRYLAKRYHQDQASENSLATYSAINITAKFLLWTVLFLLLLDNLGVNITALVTGLGIGGIAVALAVQNILGDIFASLTIVIDQPFEVGDFIVIDDRSGTVEAIGLKTSRVRALSGEQLIFPNKKLIEGYIQNFKRMQERRIDFKFSIEYNTPLDKIAAIPAAVKAIVEKQPNLRFDRAHLANLGAASLEYEVVYIMQSADYNLYMDVQQAINIEILRKLREMKVNVFTPNIPNPPQYAEQRWLPYVSALAPEEEGAEGGAPNIGTPLSAASPQVVNPEAPH